MPFCGFAQQTYTNPIIPADYSDPDVIRVGDDFYLTASSFHVTVTTLVGVSHLLPGERSGLMIMGRDYSYISVAKSSSGIRLIHGTRFDAAKGTAEEETATAQLNASSVYFRVSVVGEAICAFSYSLDGKKFTAMGDIFVAKPGIWIGAKVGLFALGPTEATRRGHADYDWFRFSRPPRSAQNRARVR